MEPISSLQAELRESNQKLKRALTGGGSDANRIAQAGTPVVDGVAPAGGCFHSEREYLRVDTIENRVRMLSRFLPLL